MMQNTYNLISAHKQIIVKLSSEDPRISDLDLSFCDCTRQDIAVSIIAMYYNII